MRNLASVLVTAITLGVAVSVVFATDRTPAEKLLDRIEESRKAAPQKFTEEEYERLANELQNDVGMERLIESFERDMKKFAPASKQQDFNFQSPRLDQYVPPTRGTRMADQEILAMR